jgi:hypothetical protein
MVQDFVNTHLAILSKYVAVTDASIYNLFGLTSACEADSTIC